MGCAVSSETLPSRADDASKPAVELSKPLSVMRSTGGVPPSDAASAGGATPSDIASSAPAKTILPLAMRGILSAAGRPRNTGAAPNLGGRQARCYPRDVTGNTTPRAPQIRDVARLAGVSHQTVSRVINDSSQVRPETRARVLTAMEQLDYRANPVARALTTGRSRTLGVVTFDMTLFGPASTMYGIERAARDA